MGNREEFDRKNQKGERHIRGDRLGRDLVIRRAHLKKGKDTRVKIRSRDGRGRANSTGKNNKERESLSGSLRVSVKTRGVNLSEKRFLLEGASLEGPKQERTQGGSLDLRTANKIRLFKKAGVGGKIRGESLEEKMELLGEE